MDDWEVLKSAEAIFQTYDTSGTTAHYRTALVLRQDDVRPIAVGDSRPPFGLFLIEVGRDNVERPNSLQLLACDTSEEAKRRAVAWLGSEREVTADKVPLTVLHGAANVMRDPALLAKYAP
jgi:hypothetical protein